MKFYGVSRSVPIASIAKFNYVMSIHGCNCNQKVSSKCLFIQLIVNWCRIYLIGQDRCGEKNEKNLSFSIGLMH